jgi:putative transposase
LLALLQLLFFSRPALIAENLFLRRQLALFLERKEKPRRSTRALRLWMVTLGRFFDWREALVVVQPETFLKWHRTAFRAFWRWKSRKNRGRPALPANIRALIVEMARANVTWGEERIANELKLNLGILVSPRTVRKYLNLNSTSRASARMWTTAMEHVHSQSRQDDCGL